LDVCQEKLFNGQLPNRLILGCVDNRAFNGDFERNPFNFQHFLLRQLAVYLDGQQIGIKPIALDYANVQYVTSFMSLFNGTGKDNRDEGNDIDPQEYANGSTLYAFDLSPDLTDRLSGNRTCRPYIWRSPDTYCYCGGLCRVCKYYRN